MKIKYMLQELILGMKAQGYETDLIKILIKQK